MTCHAKYLARAQIWVVHKLSIADFLCHSLKLGLKLSPRALKYSPLQEQHQFLDHFQRVAIVVLQYLLLPDIIQA